MVQEAVRKADALIEALPYIKDFKNKFVVVKLGGSAQDDAGTLRKIFADIDFMLAVGMRPLVVYGGGKRISRAMEAAGLEPKFVHGQRVTTPEAMEIAARVLIDEIGAELLGLLEECGGRGELLNGRDHAFLRAIKKRVPEYPDVDLGCVGEPVAIDAVKVYQILERGRLPLIAPIGRGCAEDRNTIYNINGDNAAALIARDLHAEKLVFLSDIPGVYREKNDPASLFTHLDEKGVRQLIGEGVISGGMIPKAQACLYSLDGGVRKVHIIPGSQERALLLEIFTNKGIGTEMVL